MVITGISGNANPEAWYTGSKGISHSMLSAPGNGWLKE
jgi:hypothetical protein